MSVDKSWVSSFALGKRYERAIAAAWAEAKFSKSAVVAEFEGRCDLDFLIIQAGKVVAALEVKRRREVSTRYDTIICNLSKHLLAQQFLSLLHIPTYFVVLYDDTVAEWRLDEGPAAIGFQQNRGVEAQATAHYRVARATFYPHLKNKIEQEVS